MIFARRGIEIDRYPAIKAHLERHRSALEPRPKNYTGTKWPGRKPGTYKWYEIQDAVDYYQLFERPKLVWKDISFHSAFAWDADGFFTNDLCFFLTQRDPWLLSVLNSPAMWAWLWRNTLHGKDEALRLKTVYMNHAPIPHPTAEQHETVCGMVEEVVEQTRLAQETIGAVLDLLRVQYDVQKAGAKLADFASLGSDEFVREVKKRRPRKGASLSLAGLKELRELYETEVPGILDKRVRILSHERAIAGGSRRLWAHPARPRPAARNPAAAHASGVVSLGGCRNRRSSQ